VTDEQVEAAHGEGVGGGDGDGVGRSDGDGAGRGDGDGVGRGDGGDGGAAGGRRRGGRGPVTPSPAAGFLAEPPATAAAQRLYDEDVDELGYVMNLSRLWAHQPAAQERLFDLIGHLVAAAGLTFRQRGVLVAATAAARGDAYCAVAWGTKLAAEAGEGVAAAVLRGDDDGLDPTEAVLAAWARRVVVDPNGVGAADVDALRAAGFDDARIAAVTAFVALRLAFSTVNDALGARPDHAYAEAAPPAVRAAVTFGRPLAED
jgi:uncharacterized peroxidase-related enzyme